MSEHFADGNDNCVFCGIPLCDGPVPKECPGGLPGGNPWEQQIAALEHELATLRAENASKDSDYKRLQQELAAARQEIASCKEERESLRNAYSGYISDSQKWAEKVDKQLAEAMQEIAKYAKELLAQKQAYMKIVSELEQELERVKLRWQTGKPPCTGRYLIKMNDGTWHGMLVGVLALESCDWSKTEWAGPIPEQEEKE